MNLYDIDEKIEKLAEKAVDYETGEIIEGVALELELLEMARDKKIENTACYIKNLSAEVAAFDAEIKTLKERKERTERRREWLERYLKGYLSGEKFNSARVSISYRTSKSVNVFGDIPDEYKRVKTIEEPDKTKIKKAIESGAEVPGAELRKNVSMLIK